MSAMRTRPAAVASALTPPPPSSDLKPQNVLIDAEGRGKLCDFGLAKTRNTTASAVSTAGGTFSYMAPEVPHTARRARALDLTPRARSCRRRFAAAS